MRERLGKLGVRLQASTPGELRSLLGFIAEQPEFAIALLSLLGQARAGAAAPVKVDLGLPLQSRLPEGRLYFLSPLHLR